jgi:N-methylhydantoinase A
VQTIYARLSALDRNAFATRCRAFADDLVGQLRRGALSFADVTIVAGVDVRYRGQTYELTVPIEAPDFSVDRLADDFHRAHLLRYGHSFEDYEVEILNLRMAAIGSLDSRPGGVPSWPDFPARSRPVFWGPAIGWQETPIVSRAHVTEAGGIEGPAIVEPADATIVIPPGVRARVAAGGCLLVSRS